jgi:hypothetical protein
VIRSWRIRLVTPAGRDLSPSHGSCGGIGPPGSWTAAWSPDGDRIAVQTTGLFPTADARKRLPALYVMNADGSGLQRVRRGTFVLSGAGDALLRPLWLP